MSKSTGTLTSALGLDGYPVEQPIPGERRSEYRRNVDMSGVCEFAPGGERRDCRIADITNAGAQLHFEAAEGVPDRFTLYILPLNSILDCTVRWRQDNRIGISFSTFSDNAI